MTCSFSSQEFFFIVSRYPSSQTSEEIWLSKCHFYFIETLMKQGVGKDCLSVGMKLPNGTYERPIQKAHLFWVRPGKLDKLMNTLLVIKVVYL